MPDSVVGKNYDLDIDLDNNNVDDYRFHGEVVAGPPSSEFTFIEAGGVGSSNYTLNTSATELSVLNFGDPINSSATIWHQLTSSNAVMTTYLSGSPVAGLWPNQVDKFIGVQFLINSNYHFGWIKVTTDPSSNKMAVKEYAYNTTPGDPILAGQTAIISTSINETIYDETKLYPNPAEDKIYISGWGKTIKTIVAVDVTGKQFEIDYKTIASGRIELYIEHLKPGFYSMIVTDITDDVFIQKIFKISYN
jgi:hypothetical protein